MSAINQFVLHVATVNGSGSQSANQVLLKSLFQMGLKVGGKNLFPSNIAGLPTWFTIRVHPQGYTSRLSHQDILVAMNPATWSKDLKDLKPGGFLLYTSEIKVDPTALRQDIHAHPIAFRDLVEGISPSVKLKKLLVNMVYVGLLSELLEIPEECSRWALEDQFAGKGSVVDTNWKAFQAGALYAREHLVGLRSEQFPYRVQRSPDSPCETSEPKVSGQRLLMDGNSATAIGAVVGGCTFASWYPITPSSSVMESFVHWAGELRPPSQGKTYAVVQAEDEIAAISMVIGAGWAGSRAMTATSGPGLSLMAEAAGLAYYAEIPAVIFNVQRAGPSTGLPTRTLQGDVLAAAYLSHGDTRHILLFPGNLEECYEFAQVAFDLAERCQSLVIVLTDLDLGMNLHVGPRFAYPQKPYDRGKVLDKEDLDRLEGDFARYRDVDGDGICYRTLPLTEHPKAAYFTRGTGHNETSGYSEDPEVFRRNLERLKKKFLTARSHVPAALWQRTEGSGATTAPRTSIGIIAYGSSHEAMTEAMDLLAQEGVACEYLRLRAYPFSSEVEDFLKAHQDPESPLFLVEQNRDAQMLSLLKEAFPQLACKTKPVLQFDGLPLEAAFVAREILSEVNS